MQKATSRPNKQEWDCGVRLAKLNEVTPEHQQSCYQA